MLVDALYLLVSSGSSTGVSSGVEDSSIEEDSLGASGTSAGEHADKTDASIITVNNKARNFFKLFPSFTK
jgi:hypothetical protein